jgi:muconolactone delta-isomerase
MKILAVDKILPGATEEKIKSHLKEEAAKGWELYNAGIFREMYFKTGDTPGAVLILETASVEEARQILNELPLVKEGLVDFEIIPLGPFIPFGMLFAQ